MSEYSEEYEAVAKAIEQLVEMGFVEVKGITEDGEWLYGVTEAGENLVLMDGIATAISSITEHLEDED